MWGATKINETELYGINAIGRLLMEVREKYAKGGEKLDCVHPPDITGFLLFEHSIEMVCNEDYYIEMHGNNENDLVLK